jgi:O-antigen/teichoic acid export membrane protein
MRTSEIVARLASGAFWSILGNALGRGLVLIALIIVARLIGQKKYGELSMIRSTILMFSVFSGAGLGLTASRYIALNRNTDPQKMYEVYLLSRYFSIGLGFLIMLLLCVFAPVIAEQSLHKSELTNDIRFGAIVLFFITISSVQTGVLQGFEQFRTIAINTFFFGIAQLVCLSLGAFLYGVRGVILGMGLSYFLLCLFNQWFIYKNITNTSNKYSTKRIHKETLSILWKFSLPAVMSSILVIPVIWWCKTMIVKFGGFESAANYDVAEQWSMIILFIPTTLAGMIIPLLSNTLSEGTTAQYRKLININIIINTLITILFSSGIVLLSSVILKFYGPAFNDTRTFSMLVLSTIPNAIVAVLGNIIASKGKMWMGFVLNFIWAIWLILFFLFFVVKMNYGAFGFALAMLIAYILHVIFSYAYMWIKVMNNNDPLNKDEMYEKY